MSFIFAAVHNGTNIYLASDSQMTNNFTGKISHNENKIIDINGHVGVVFAGNADLCEKTVNALKNDYSQRKYVPVLQSDIAKDLIKYIEKIAPQWSNDHFGISPDATFLVAGYDSIFHTPGITTIILHQNTVTPYSNRGWQSGEYFFSLSNPVDIQTDDCIQLCTQFLSQPENLEQEPETTLRNLIALIAEKSEFVDNIPKIWQAHRYR